MRKLKYLSLIIILCFGISLVFVIFRKKTRTPFKLSLAPFLQLAGQPVKTIDSNIAKVLPVTESDEQEFGTILSRKFIKETDKTDPTYLYLNTIITNISKNCQKPFKYKVFILDSRFPNAFALPGGIVLVTKGLLSTLDSEAQLVSILAHEVGHIECNHCLSAIKYQLLTEKINLPEIGKLGDFLTKLFFRQIYSKTQENEADEYGYRLLLKTKYNPSATAQAFIKLQEAYPSYTSDNTNLFRDYYSSHPPLPLRISKYTAEADKWWNSNSKTRRYNGRSNLKNRESFFNVIIEEEWSNKFEERQ